MEAGNPPPTSFPSKAVTTVLPLPSASLEELTKQAVIRTGKAEIDHVGVVLDREVDRFRQAQRVANGRRRGGRLDLPAGAQPQQPCAGRHSGDTHAIVGLCGDDSRDFGAVLLDRKRLTGDEVAVDQQLAGKVRVHRFDAAVDDGNPERRGRWRSDAARRDAIAAPPVLQRTADRWGTRPSPLSLYSAID